MNKKDIREAIKQMKKDGKEYEERGYYVHLIKDVYKNDPFVSNWINIHTHGLEKYGVTNVSIVAPENDDRFTHVIPTVANMLKNGEKFDLDAIHIVYKSDKTVDFTFKFLPKTCFGEDTLRIILPDPNVEADEYFSEDIFVRLQSPYLLQESIFFEICESIIN